MALACGDQTDNARDNPVLIYYPEGEQRMKKAAEPKAEEFTLKIPGIILSAKEQASLEAAVKALNEQNEQLGLLDPLDAEPATLFFAEGKQ
jgi:hypothetical protein